MGLHQGGYPVQNLARHHSLAGARLHGLLPLLKQLPCCHCGNVLQYFQWRPFQLDLLPCGYRAGDDCDGLAGSGTGTA